MSNEIPHLYGDKAPDEGQFVWLYVRPAWVPAKLTANATVRQQLVWSLLDSEFRTPDPGDAWLPADPPNIPDFQL